MDKKKITTKADRVFVAHEHRDYILPTVPRVIVRQEITEDGYHRVVGIDGIVAGVGQIKGIESHWTPYAYLSVADIPKTPYALVSGTGYGILCSEGLGDGEGVFLVTRLSTLEELKGTTRHRWLDRKKK